MKIYSDFIHCEYNYIYFFQSFESSNIRTVMIVISIENTKIEFQKEKR